MRIYNYVKGTRIASFDISSNIPQELFSLPDKNLLAVRTNSDITFYDYTTFKVK